MDKVSVIGCGSSAMIFAHALLNKGGYDITVYSDRTAHDWLHNSAPTGMPFAAGETIDIERELGIQHWEDELFLGDGVLLDYRRTKGEPPLTVRGRFGKLGAAMDLRPRIARWMTDFEDRGGNLVVETVSAQRVEEIAAQSDLTLLASGKGEIGNLVPRDDVRSEFDAPQRKMFAGMIKGVQGWPHRSEHLTRPIKFTFFGDAGEWFFVPFMHKDAGPCYSLNIMVRTGSYMDRFDDCTSCAEYLEIAKELIKECSPEDYEGYEDLEPIDDRYNYFSFKRGIQPLVRQAYGDLPTGDMIIPLGDAGIVYDPIGGQGYNSASRHAKFVADAVIEKSMPYDRDWAKRTFDAFWEGHGRWACEWNNLMLKGLGPAAGMIMQKASEDRVFADQLFQNYFGPRPLFPAMGDQAAAEATLSAYSTTGRAFQPGPAAAVAA